MANYNVNIVNGEGSANMKKGVYTVTVVANGYEATTLNPATYTAGETAGSGAFTVSANGHLTLVFNETGAEGGANVTAGSVVMTDQTGNQTYGSAVTIDANGQAEFPNVPYNAQTPYALYFKQTATDDGHNVFEGVIAVNMSAQTQTEYVVNTPIALQTITLTDANYQGLPVANATMQFEEQQ